MLVIVTGASSGFGYHISKRLIEDGHQVIGIARRENKLSEIKTQLGEQFIPLALDMRLIENIELALEKLPTEHSLDKVDALINNAGLALGLERADQANLADWQQMIDTNITALVSITRIVLPHMTKNNHGTIINIGSIAGTYPYPGGNVYGASKAFVEQFSLNLRADLAGLNIRVSNVAPGLCSDTEFSHVRFKGDSKKVASTYADVDAIKPVDIANTVAWILYQPSHININRIEIMPTAQSFNPLKVSKKSEV